MTRPQALLAIGLLAAVAAALAVRLPHLAQRPMHGDEANQAKKTGDLLETGVYVYDPQQHHGPTLYWCTLPALWLAGAHDFAASDEFDYRIVPVLFSAGLVLLLWLTVDGLGRWPTLIAAALTAASPAMVYYGRYYIQETLLVCFTFAAIACGWRYVRSRRLVWAGLAGASVGLMHATKETWILAASAAVVGLLAAGALRRRLWREMWPAALVALAAALVVAVALYSSFGRNWHGPLDSLLAYQHYLRRGSEAGEHTHPWYFYLELLIADRPARGFFWTEGLIVGLAAVGAGKGLAGIFATRRQGAAPAATAAVPPNGSARFVRFLTGYMLALTAICAAIPYKTPWCMLSFLHGMILLAGVGAAALVAWVPRWPLKSLVAAGLLLAFAHLARECYLLNGRFASDFRNPYVYAHPTGEVLKLAEKAERLAQVAPEGYDARIDVIVPENFWPLPWYLRRFRRVGYWQSTADWARDTAADPSPAMVILSPEVQEEIDRHLRGDYNRQMISALRPGALVDVYVRQSLWDALIAVPPLKQGS